MNLNSMTKEEIKTLDGKTIILRRKMFIGDKSNYDIECSVIGVLEKSVICKPKRKKVFIPIIFFMEDRAALITPEGKPIVYLPHWFNY